MFLVSGCLLGNCCRYDGLHQKNEKVIAFLKDKEYIAICPECMGGLSTPREPSEIVDGKVKTRSGLDVTEAFNRGAKQSVELAKKFSCKQAILKENSPSCGSYFVYDGSFQGKIISGVGISAKMLTENGIEVISSAIFDEKNL